jgi:hypothetical protein
MRHLRPSRIRIRFEKTDSRHNEPGHAKCALETLFIDYALLYGMKRSVRTRQPFDGDNF